MKSPLRSAFIAVGRLRGIAACFGLALLGACGSATGSEDGATTESSALSVPALGCGVVLSVPGSYALTKNLVCAGTAITVTSSHVTLNLGGHTLTSADGAGDGVRVNGDQFPGIVGVVVENGVIAKFATGIETRMADALVERVTMRSNGTGLSVYGETQRTRMNDCQLDGNDYGVNVSRGHATLKSVDIEKSRNGGAGCFFGGSLDIEDSTIAGSGPGGGVSYAKAGGTVTTSTISGNAGGGLFAVESDVTISENQIHANPGGGIYVRPLGMTAVIAGNVVTENGSPDLADYGSIITNARSAPCSAVWKNNVFETSNRTCIH